MAYKCLARTTVPRPGWPIFSAIHGWSITCTSVMRDVQLRCSSYKWNFKLTTEHISLIPLIKLTCDIKFFALNDKYLG